MILNLEETFIVGEDTFFESISHVNLFGVTFEDDLTTGYFYAINTKPELSVLNGLHIYDVTNVVDKTSPSKIQIAWSDDGLIASLLINEYCHAILDFANKIGYCRNGFPENSSGWTNKILTAQLIAQIFLEKE